MIRHEICQFALAMLRQQPQADLETLPDLTKCDHRQKYRAAHCRAREGIETARAIVTFATACFKHHG
jgi:hypothetical protein